MTLGLSLSNRYGELLRTPFIAAYLTLLDNRSRAILGCPETEDRRITILRYYGSHLIAPRHHSRSGKYHTLGL